MSKWGIVLANADNAADLDRVDALGCTWYVALHYQLADLVALCRRRPGSRGVVRYFRRDLLSLPPETVALSVNLTWRQMQAAGLTDLIPGNEFNNQTEGRVYSPADAAARLRLLLAAIRTACPGARLHLPAFSPPLDGASYYLACQDAGTFDLVDVVDVHAYGDSDDALAWVDLVTEIAREKPVAVTEYNFGAGRRVDPWWYAEDALRFFAGLERRPQVEAGAVFIWHWQDPDAELATTLDVRGQPIEQAIKDAVKQEVGMSLQTEYPQAYEEWVRAGGIENNLRKHLLGIGILKPTAADLKLLASECESAVKQLEAAIANFPFA